ncbi:early nodulin-93 [Chlorella sorokiniana]|uniref:Early nodulin-93 n=1 Tax=Chlorella sorokiniana TaxID=3076 RepID=A0A2P6U230_CHLSO|nr:early nodulin-93 [Chlorella sorokiniana]|eukprot:PRW60364.1 early nodulin-93 [Chlorella sorokiniana]
MSVVDTILKTIGYRTTDPSVIRSQDVQTQSAAVKEATVEGLVGAGMALACSSVVIMGACKLFPRFNRSLSVSGRTALIVTPAFGAFFLLAELKMNEFKKMRKHLPQQ